MKILVYQHDKSESFGTFADGLERIGAVISVDHLYQTNKPTPPESFDALIVMGGPMNVYEEDIYPFLKPETELLAEWCKADRPTLGVCLGSQLIAKALGAKVYQAVRREIGMYDLELTPEGRKDPLLSRLTSPFQTFQWHGDTFDIPRGALPLARGDEVPNQAFRYKSAVWALQFHMEITPTLIRAWCRGNGDYVREGGFDTDDIIRQSEENYTLLNNQAQSIIERFVDVIEERSV